MSFLDRISSWWNKDKLVRTEEETGMTSAEREAAEEDYQGRKDDISASGRYGTAGVDFERDSEPPRYP